jgi:hypothetical protein
MFDMKRKGETMLNKKCVVFAMVIMLSLCLVMEAKAGSTWAEDGDAGKMLISAQDVIWPTQQLLDMITGDISLTNDIDMYRIYIDDVDVFEAWTVDPTPTLPPPPQWDPALWLFDEGGNGVIADDDTESISGPTLEAKLSKGTIFKPTAPGIYYLAICSAANGPRATDNYPIFFDPTIASDFNQVYGPYPGFPKELIAWEETVGTGPGDYQIHLAGALSVPNLDPVPIPGAVWLLGSESAIDPINPLVYIQARHHALYLKEVCHNI